MKITEKSANLIVNIYKKNNALTRLLKTQSTSRVIELNQIGDVINLRLNASMDSNNTELFLKGITDTISFIKIVEDNNDVQTRILISKYLEEIRKGLEALKGDIISKS